MQGGVQIEFLAPRRRLVGPDAVLVLHGASVAGLTRASRWLAGSSTPPLLVAVDGGLATCRNARRTPDLFVGDADSTHRRPRGIESVVFPRDKSFSDLAGALVELARRKVANVSVAGVLGGRLDHEWANLLELGAHADRFVGIVVPTPRATIAITSVGCRVESAKGSTVSLFALNGYATVSLQGVRWKLRRRRLRPGSEGLSNLSEGEITLTVHGGAAALMLLPERKSLDRRASRV